MSLQSETNRLLTTTAEIGKAAIHHLYPDEFEYYAFAFELLDENFRTDLYMLFPIMPESIYINEVPLVNIKKTASGVVSIFSDSFQPFDIRIAGTFGRKFRILPSTGFGSGENMGNAFVSGKLSSVEQIRGQSLGSIVKEARKGLKEITQTFSYAAKTGYGTMKVLESILAKAKTASIKKNKPYYLVMYNLAFNQSYIVEVVTKSFYQDRQNNMIWFYDIALRAVAPSSELMGSTRNKGSIVKTLTASSVVKGINTLSNIAKDLAKNGRNQLLNKLEPSRKGKI